MCSSYLSLSCQVQTCFNHTSGISGLILSPPFVLGLSSYLLFERKKYILSCERKLTSISLGQEKLSLFLSPPCCPLLPPQGEAEGGAEEIWSSGKNSRGSMRKRNEAGLTSTAGGLLTLRNEVCLPHVFVTEHLDRASDTDMFTGEDWVSYCSHSIK